MPWEYTLSSDDISDPGGYNNAICWKKQDTATRKGRRRCVDIFYILLCILYDWSLTIRSVTHWQLQAIWGTHENVQVYLLTWNARQLHFICSFSIRQIHLSSGISWEIRDIVDTWYKNRYIRLLFLLSYQDPFSSCIYFNRHKCWSGIDRIDNMSTSLVLYDNF